MSFGEFKNHSHVKEWTRQRYQDIFYPHLERVGRYGLKVRVGYYAPELEREEKWGEQAGYHSPATALRALKFLEYDLKQIQYAIKSARRAFECNKFSSLKSKRKERAQRYLWTEALHARYRSQKYGVARMRKAIQKQLGRDEI